MSDASESWFHEAALCSHHVDRASVGTCRRCGDFLCSDCAVAHSDGWSCRACLRASPLGASWLALAAGMLGFVSFCLPPLAVGAFLCSAIDFSRIASRSAPREGWKLNALGFVMAIAAVLVWGLILFRMAHNVEGTLSGLDNL